MRQISEEVQKVLGLSKLEKGVLYLPPIQLDRKLYLEVNRVLKSLGGRWNRRAKGHTGIDPGLYEMAILVGEYIRPEDFGFYESPPEVVNRILELAEIQEGDRVLEPSAGRGAIVSKIPENVDLVCVELLENNIDALKSAMERIPNSICDQEDFLKWDSDEKFDKIVMNPPFAPKQADIDHVLYALNFLKPGGRLISVMAAGVLFRSNKKTVDFRKTIELMKGEFEKLPPRSFKSVGTDVETVLIDVEMQ